MSCKYCRMDMCCGTCDGANEAELVERRKADWNGGISRQERARIAAETVAAIAAWLRPKYRITDGDVDAYGRDLADAIERGEWRKG